MAIVEKLLSLKHYPVMAMTAEAHECLQTAVETLSTTPKSDKRSYPLKLKLLDCYCDLTNTTLTRAALCTSEIQVLFDSFCGAVMSGDLVNKPQNQRANICRELAMILNKAREENPDLWPITWQPKALHTHAELWAHDKKKIQNRKSLFWCGWTIVNRNGGVDYFPIPQLWISHGQEFSISFYDGLNTHISGEAVGNLATFKKMALFLVDNPGQWPAETFTDPGMLSQFLNAFAKHHYKGVTEKTRNLPPKKKNWNRFLSRLREYFITPGTWATPFFPLPFAPRPNMRGHQSHVREMDDGLEVKEKLITDIPLHITNSEAIQLLFFQITKDLNVVRSWSDHQRETLVRNNELRRLAAESGIPLDQSKRIASKSVTFENICASFEARPYEVDLPRLLKAYNQQQEHEIPLRDFTYLLGIPSTLSFFPFQCGLILEHPHITRSFLINFKLYDKHGQMTGFFHEDGAYHIGWEDGVEYLSGIKARSGAKHARQTYPLTKKAAEIIKQIIELTTPARNHLRKKGDQNWKLLFLGSEKGASHPTKCAFPSLSDGGGPVIITEIMTQFAPHTSLRDKALRKFISRINPGAIRAQCIVEDYIEHADSERASRLLGHNKERPVTMESYIPAPVVAFIETRGVRLIQKTIICHALASSIFFLRASSFESLDILSDFLNNHVDPTIPAQLSDPDGLEEKELTDLEQELILKIGVGALSTLLSIEIAVKNSPFPAKILPDAFYWAKVSELLTKEIHLMHDPLLKDHLSKAESAADPSQVDKFIYAA
ncbi:hypothetical protein ACFW6U_16215 [Pseudomonas guariconensis]|uniref:hypothetical protein n=1 Tax=Pseudomonas guariconensis TaxID=1288410 RepID=UPI0036714411